MLTGSSSLYVLCSAFTVLLSTCWQKTSGLKEEEKTFHAGPPAGQSGFGTTFFTLHKDGKYLFCQGDFMNPGCYTGDFILSGDTITLLGLRQHKNIPANKFLIIRYAQKDSSYWEWKYPDHKADWKSMYKSDRITDATGDVWPLEQNGKPVRDRKNHFIIRLDSLKYN
ncbi:hypothetical protein [uncultured Chitinophaga sp.]|uniref:hypothetical protein n=1 Tax=uncultured Chitinophaga sp. TaxID=339340 RepID=UPI0025F44B75|nr:hypothetical protein [uncultured Chitinophaga sp.]